MDARKIVTEFPPGLDGKRSVFIPIQKNAQTTAQLHSSHMLVK